MTDLHATGARPNVDAVVIGAGFAGLYMVHRLRDELGLNVRGIEAGSEVGGTWYWNRYPGARTDSPYSAYGFSFSDEIAERWSWSERYPGQAEVLKYLNFVADHFDLRRNFQFDARVESAHYDDDSGLWRVTLSTGEVVLTTYVVTAIGLLSAPNVPDFPGLQDRFRGQWHHTATWPESGLDLAGKRVGIIGTGSTGIQVLTSIAADAGHVTVFQRTPNYVVPSQNRPLTDDEKDALKRNHREVAEQIRQHPFAMPFTGTGKTAMSVDDATRKELYEAAWQKGGFHFMFESFDDISIDPEANETACEFVREKIGEIVDDPEVAELLSPRGYPYGSKRPPAGTNYYETFNRDNVSLVDVHDDPITGFTETGLTTRDREFELDVVLFATGFDASTGSFDRIDIRGRDGAALKDKWADGPLTNLGFSAAGFPNLLMITGPLSPFANIPTCIEETTDWIFECIAYLRKNELVSIEADESAERAWADHVTEIANVILAAKGEAVNTWFAGANIDGKSHAINVYFGGANAYFDMCRASAAENYKGFVLA